jgi:hypothetical protein
LSESRYTFSQVMSQLIELESMMAEFYRSSAEKIESTGPKSLFLEYEAASRRRIDSLDKVRRGTIIEMALETIAGLELDEVKLRIGRTIESKGEGDRDKAAVLEGIMQSVYSKTSERLQYVSAEAGELLRRFQLESLRRRERLAAGTEP